MNPFEENYSSLLREYQALQRQLKNNYLVSRADMQKLKEANDDLKNDNIYSAQTIIDNLINKYFLH